MTALILNDGRPVVVEEQENRIGRGPWARLLASAVVGDEGSATAERGRRLAHEGTVHTVRVAGGELSGVVDGHTVTIVADRMPPRIWTAISRFARGSRPLEAAVAGREQSVHLEHLLAVDWDAPLVPRGQAIAHTCTCPLEGACEHVVALAYVFAAEVDRDPSLLLRWRGCLDDSPPAEPKPALPILTATGAETDHWTGGPLPEPRPPRPLPPGAVLKRLGPSGLRAGGSDLGDALQRAYAIFAGSGSR
jgi:hypothetical protein